MNFVEAYKEMVKGNKITRPAFKGFWFIDPVKGKLTIHLSSGKEITYGQIDLTAKNCMAEDWVIYEEPKKPEETESK